MGAYSPAPVVTPAVHEHVMREIMEPVVDALHAAKIEYRGVLYAGLMMTDRGPKVLEFNARFGDPECQPLMLRLKSDLVQVMDACIDGRLGEITLEWDPRAAVCVVLAAAGYPGSYERGKLIHGLDGLRSWRNGVVFHAGTARRDDSVVTNGGRVLGVTALGDTVRDAVREAYWGVEQIGWDGMQYRRDIGYHALDRHA
jgi:phosphoribosylamine--glycine ligase